MRKPGRTRANPFQALGANAYLPPPTMNTTPLIDVMLVLLIMFIVTIPISTHKVPLDLPNGPVTPRETVVHRLDMDARGAIAWDGQALELSSLRARLAAMIAEPDSELHMRADGETPYGRFDEVLAEVKRAGVTRLGMVSNERFAGSGG